MKFDGTNQYYREGMEAFNAGVGATSCPYSFDSSPYWDTKNYSAFEQEWRWKLNAWMDGWIAAKKVAEAK